MFALSRTVRFFLNDGDPPAPADGRNGHSAWPPARGLGRYFELSVTCEGEPDIVSGYFLNIHAIDNAVRTHGIPALRDGLGGAGVGSQPAGRILQAIVAGLQPALQGSVRSTVLMLSPQHSLTIRSHRMQHVIIRQQFEFAAAHRLNVDAWSEEENRRYFGKCNNPSGHGHNYRFEVAVEAPIDAEGQIMPVEDLDALVGRVVLHPFDHKNLNVDVPQFESLNPSVEHIAMIIYQMLSEQISTLGIRLHEVSVWETDRTVCTYRGSDDASAPAASVDTAGKRTDTIPS